MALFYVPGTVDVSIVSVLVCISFVGIVLALVGTAVVRKVSALVDTPLVGIVSVLAGNVAVGISGKVHQTCMRTHQYHINTARIRKIMPNKIPGLHIPHDTGHSSFILGHNLHVFASAILHVEISVS